MFTRVITRTTLVCAGRIIISGTLAAGLTVILPASAANVVTVSTTPVGWTPYLLPTPVNQTTEELRPCKGTMYAAGTITDVGRGSATYARSNAFSFSAKTGAMTNWAPKVNGPVRSIALSPDCRTAYLGGNFTRVNSVAAMHLVAVNTVTGAVRRRFQHQTDGPVFTVRYARGAVIIGGEFTNVNGVRRTQMASLDPATGAVTSYLQTSIAGAYLHTTPQVYNSQLSHDRHRLLVEGVFTSIDGHARQQAAVLRLGRSDVRLGRWRSSELFGTCVTQFYVRAGAWSPDDSIIYLATTGERPTSGPGSIATEPRAGLCDAVASFPATHGSVSHTWVNYSGCDSYYSVAADNDNVYVSGHNRWANNLNGCDVAGLGAVSRPGIASIDPRTGVATSWNPTRSRGRGSHQLLITKAGLWAASDTWIDGTAQNCGGLSQHGGICFLPY